MQQEQQAKSDSNFDDINENGVLGLKRQEAKVIYKHFCKLSKKNEPDMAFEVISGVDQYFRGLCH